MEKREEPIRLVRIIARLNIGGPAIQAITLTRLLEERGYRTRLVRGREAPTEGSMDDLAAQLGVTPTLVSSLRRDPGLRDFAALARLISIMRRDHPQVVHTHAAKGGTLGRLAAVLAYPRRSRRPVLIHTFHGHSLAGYFSARSAQVFLSIERWLARRTDALVAISPEVRDDLVRLGVADEGRFVVVPLGFDLLPFLDDSDRARRRAAVRYQWGIGSDERVVTLVARLVPIKRVDRFLRLALLIAERQDVRFVIVGDGELREQLTGSAEARTLGPRLVWAGFRRDMPDVCFASDVVVLVSDNEGTPVSLIEAQAAGVPVVATDVGGVRSVVSHGQTGMLAAPEDTAGLRSGILDLLDDPALAAALGEAGREQARERWTLPALVRNLDNLYNAALRAHQSRMVATGARPPS